MDNNDLIIYKNSDGNIIVDAIFKDETLWLTQKGMSKVFDCSTDNISLHLKNIFKDNELDENSVVEDSSVTASDYSGSISRKQAVEKAESEYEKYRIIQDQKYISSMDEFYNKYLEENKDNNKKD